MNIQDKLKRVIDEGTRGRTVYINSVREMLEEDPDCVPVVLRLRIDRNGSGMDFTLRIPRPAGLDRDVLDFLREYIAARIYNIISSYGGTEMVFYLDFSVPGLAALFGEFNSLFGAEESKKERKGYGRALNVAERTADALAKRPPGSSRFRFRREEIGALTKEGSITEPEKGTGRSGELSEYLRTIPEKLSGKRVLGMDIGGSDIKLVLVIDGKIVAYKEYDWFPALFTRSAQLIEPVLLLARWGRVRALAATEDGPARMCGLLDSVSGADASFEETMHAVTEAERYFGEALQGLEAIGLCFPDVVVRNKIVGGEVYKTRGIRGNPEIDYESDFAGLTGLDDLLSGCVRAGGYVRIINDGPMAAFTAAVEMVCSGTEDAGGGVFAHTLGTELGTGWIGPAGNLPELPLEIYNYVIDLGSRDGRLYHSDDPRSVNNFNTGLPGTLQKYVSQSGVFRLALKYFAEERPELYRELFERGFLRTAEDGSIRIVEQPVDMRKPLLEHLMSLPSRGEDEAVYRIFRDIGEYLAVTWLETENVLSTGIKTRILFGRLVKDRLCFSLMCEGARRVTPELRLEAADENSACTPLMKQLRDDGRYTVAQFAQAVGAVHYAVSSE